MVKEEKKIKLIDATTYHLKIVANSSIRSYALKINIQNISREREKKI